MHKTVIKNRYSIIGDLGGGGMAKVYLAHDDVLDRDVALKVLREQFAEDELFVERFEREARSAAALSHPNIVSVYDRGEEDGTSYIAMEHVPGGTLKERILRDGPLDPGSATSLALQIAEALVVAHERGVIHRDIKPHNVLLTASGDAKVADFGIARAATAATISQTSMVLGTAAYMSPEQAMGKPATPASDLYSLGVVLYEMLTGQLPYTAESPVAVSMKHVNEPLHPPQKVNPGIPEGLNAVIVKLLAKNPEDRYESAAELAEDLRRVRDGLPPLSAGEGTGKTARLDARTTLPLPGSAMARRSRRAPWILAGLLSLLALLGAGWTLSQGLLEEPPLPEAAVGVKVPSVKGLPEEQAKKKLATAGFKVEVRRRESSAADAGKVLDQSPAARERAEKGSRVTIQVGDGPATVAVPEVVGLSFSEAEAALDKAGLTVGVRREIPSDTAPAGVVVEQGYAPGAEVEPGTAVNLGVSSGPEQVVAPAQPAQPAVGAEPPVGDEAQNAIEDAVKAQQDAIEAQQDAIEDQDHSGSGGGGSGNSGSGSGG